MSSAPEEKMKLVSAFFVQSPTGLKNMYGAVQVGWAVLSFITCQGRFVFFMGWANSITAVQVTKLPE
jgi:hypothetical protein